MSFSFSVLASGSAGNCTVLAFDGHEADAEAAPARRCVLIDAGLSPRRTARHLAEIGLSIRDVRAIVLTHLDTDHFYASWVKAIEKLDISVHAHHRHRGATYAAGIPMRRTNLFNGTLALDERTRIESIIFAHDALGSVGFVIEHEGRRLGFATDLGRVTDAMLDRFVDLHALAIESNYDRQMQIESARPPFLKRRIMGGMGHLSNEQALAAVEHIESQSHLSRITLLHLSRECNCPRRLHDLYQTRAPHLVERLTLSDQFEPTPLIEVTRGERRSTLPRLRMTSPTLFDHLETAAT